MSHAFAWTMTAAGVGRLWRAGQRADSAWSTKTFVGSLALGWGLFNTIEGVVDHHLLTIHRVRPGAGELGWDLAFLAFGLVLAGAGLALVRGRAPASR
jgi:uncharacterized membrane protein